MQKSSGQHSTPPACPPLHRPPSAHRNLPFVPAHPLPPAAASCAPHTTHACARPLADRYYYYHNSGLQAQYVLYTQASLNDSDPVRRR